MTSSLPTWAEMSDSDKAAAMQHVRKRETEGRSYAVEHYPCEYVDHPALTVLDEADACDHAKQVVGTTRSMFVRLGAVEYARLMDLEVRAVLDGTTGGAR